MNNLDDSASRLHFDRRVLDEVGDDICGAAVDFAVGFESWEGGVGVLVEL